MYPAFVAEGQEGTEATESITQEKGQVVKAVVKTKRLTKDVEVADIGCGFGGLLMALSPSMPDTLCLGGWSDFLAECARKRGVLTPVQASKSERKLRNTLRTRSEPCEIKAGRKAAMITRTLLVSGLTR